MLAVVSMVLLVHLLSPYCTEAKVLVKRSANHIDITSPATPTFGVSEDSIPPIDHSDSSADCANFKTVFVTDPHHSWGPARHVLHVNFTGQFFNYHTIVYDMNHKPWANDYNPAEDQVYFTNVFTTPMSGSVETEHRNGSGTTEIVMNSGLQEPFGIAIDHTSSQLFVTDAAGHKIESSDLDGGSRTTVVPGTSQSRPCAIATDSLRGFIFWTDCGSSPRVFRANRDGSGLAVIASTNLGKPYAIAVDVGEGKVYWGDGQRKVIERADMDGSNRESFLTITGGSANMYGLDVDETHVYFTDWATPSCLHVVSKATPAADYTVVGVQLMQYLTDVRVYGHCPEDYTGCDPNPCLNGGVCVPQSGGSYTCTCAAGFTGANCEAVPTTPSPYGDCDSGWHQRGSSCFKVYDTPSSYEVAESTCAAAGLNGRLAVDKTPETHDFLVSLITDVDRCDWIGVSDAETEGIWRHGDGDRVSPPFEPWAPRTFNSPNKDCVGIDKGLWAPADCDDENYFICELPLIPPTAVPDPCDPNPCLNGGTCTGVNDAEYVCKCRLGYMGTNCELSCPAVYTLYAAKSTCLWFSYTSKNYADATSDCDSKHNGRLVTIKDLDTFNYLKSRTILRENRWLGLDDRQTEGTMMWSDGDPLGSFNRLFQGHGYHNRGANDCAYINRKRQYQWYFTTCTRRYKYICQTDPQ